MMEIGGKHHVARTLPLVSSIYQQILKHRGCLCSSLAGGESHTFDHTAIMCLGPATRSSLANQLAEHWSTQGDLNL